MDNFPSYQSKQQQQEKKKKKTEFDKHRHLWTTRANLPIIHSQRTRTTLQCQCEDV